MRSRIGEVYALELGEVSIRARALGDAVEHHNFLPADFPKPQVALLVKALTGLSEGSLEGTRYPLEHAATRLSEIRRRFFQPMGAGTHVESNEQESPNLERGDALDTHLSTVIAAISTALDAYREQARADFESINSSDYIDVIPGLADAKSNIEKIDRQIVQFDDLSRKAQGQQWAGNERVRETAMSAADARNSLASTQAEVSFDVLLSGWIRRLALISADALKYLQISIDAVSTAGGVAHVFYNKYKSTIKNIREVAISEAQDWLSIISSQLKTAEFALRRKFADNEEKRIGIVRSAGRSKIILGHDNIPFAISGKEKNIPLTGDIVEFSIDQSKDKLYAKDIKHTKDYIILNRVVYKSSEAIPFIHQELMKLIFRNKKKSMRVDILQREALTHLGLPSNYWVYLGYKSFNEFLGGNKGWSLYPDNGTPQIVSVADTQVKFATKEMVLHYVVGKLLKDGPIKLSDLADDVSNHFIGGVMPIKTALGIGRFSDLFYNDPSFIIIDGVINLTGVEV